MSKEYNTKIIKLFNNFINDIINVFPEQKTNIYNNYEKELINNNYEICDSKINDFCILLDNKFDLIITKNEDIFSEKILTGVDFKKLWLSNINDKTKKNIWSYITSLLLVYLSYVISKELDCPLSSIKSKKLTSNQLEKIKKIKKLSSLVKNSSNSFMNDPALNKIFNMTKNFENTSIGNIAKNITEELNINSIMGENKDPMALLQDPSKFMNVFNGLDKKIEHQVKNGNYKKDDLLKEATEICGMMKGNQYFDNIMQQCGNMSGNMGGGGAQRTARKVRPIGKNNQNKRTKVKVKKVNNQ